MVLRARHNAAAPARPGSAGCGKIDTAKFRLQKFEEEYPGTEAAKKAKELLKNLKDQKD